MIIGYRSRLREINECTKNLNQAQIARLTGVSRQTVNRWMSDNVIMQQPDMLTAGKLATFYGLKSPLLLLEAVHEEIPGEGAQAPELSRLIHSIA